MEVLINGSHWNKGLQFVCFEYLLTVYMWFIYLDTYFTYLQVGFEILKLRYTRFIVQKYQRKIII